MRIITLAAVALSAAAMPVAAQAQRVPAAVIVVVDTDRVFRECNACRTAQTQLQSQLQALQTRQQTLVGQLRPEGEAIQTAINALGNRQPDAALNTRIQQFQQRENQAQQELSRSQQNLQSIEAHVLQQISARLSPAINAVMTARGANLAIAKSSAIDNAAALDVTNDVLARLNQTLPSVSLTPLPQQQQQQQPRPQGR
ncbi:MAG TPA: OmpH family outer membrane protein [Sphingomicrobium sp.]|jgi:outer membrane protein|nr:OmpH family outer membrane protein [Sphingomicrobium sp.]